MKSISYSILFMFIISVQNVTCHSLMFRIIINKRQVLHLRFSRLDFGVHFLLSAMSRVECLKLAIFSENIAFAVFKWQPQCLPKRRVIFNVQRDTSPQAEVVAVKYSCSVTAILLFCIIQ